MSHFSRREFVRTGSLGLAAAAAGGVVLRADAEPTEPSGELGAYGKLLADNRQANPQPPGRWAPTEDNILGPFYRQGAPYRAKITPPLEPGTVLLIRGRVWGFDSKRPLAGAVLDIWQANASGRYDNDDPRNPPAEGVFRNRARLITDENGFYEFETIHPAPYQIGANDWRPSHIHYLVRQPGYQALVTQLYFRGDPHNRTDQFIKESLIIDLGKQKVGTTFYETGAFDVVLAPAKRN